MGKWFAELGKERGWNVVVSDKDQERARKVADDLGMEFGRNEEEAVRGADIVVVSVPIKETSRVVRKISVTLEDDSLLVDIASVKEEVVKTMEGLETNSELASIHPLFGPGAKNLKDKIIVSVPVKPGETYEALMSSLSEDGANVIEMGAEKHDKIMSITQNLTHFTLLTFLSSFEEMEYAEESKSFSTPMFRGLLDLSTAFLKVNPEVCGDIQTENRYGNIARKAFREASRKIDRALEEGDIKIIRDLFENFYDKIDSKEINSAYEKLYEEE